MEGPRGSDAPSERVEVEALSLLTSKWHPVVLLALQEDEPAGFTELSDAIPAVSDKVLADALEDLCETDLIERRVVSESPLRVEYERTPIGRDLDPVFDALEAWGSQHLRAGPPTVVLADVDTRLTEMYAQWLSDAYDVRRVHDSDSLHRVMEDVPDVLVLAAEFPGAYSAVAAAPEACRTVLLLGEPPSLELLDVDCDDVLRKPIVRATVRATVEEQLARRDEPPAERERAALTAKHELLEEALPREVLEADRSHAELRVRRQEPESESE